MNRKNKQAKEKKRKPNKKVAQKRNLLPMPPQGSVLEAEQIFLVAIGTKIRNIRESKNLSIRKFAAMAGMDNSKLAKFEKGQVNYTLLTLRSISEALGVPAWTLLDV